MNTANKITMIRIFLIPVFMICLFCPIPMGRYFAVGVFVLASLTDFLDGYVARKYNQITDFGKFVDPLADKLLVTAAFIGLVEFGITPAWIVILIIARELTVTALRTIAASNGKVIAASNFGKAKTVVQLIGLIFLMLFGHLSLHMGIVPINGFVNWIMVVITVASGIDYLYKNRNLINTYR